MTCVEITYPSVDGLLLQGDYWDCPSCRGAVVMVHGITSERTEEGLYTAIADILHRSRAVLSFDLRAHGGSEGRHQDLTLHGVLNDVVASIDECQARSGALAVDLLGSSFGGGICICATSLRRCVKRLVLLNPRLEYRSWLTDQRGWSDGRLQGDSASSLRDQGYIRRGDFKMGRALVNELPHVDPAATLVGFTGSVLVIHGTLDTVVPISDSRAHFNDNGKGKLIEVEGAEHGFVDPDTDSPLTTVSRALRRQVIENVVTWIGGTTHAG